MPNPRFQPLDAAAFRSVLERFPFRRKIDGVHLHHTWRPNHAQYRGHDTILSMWRYHTQELHWSDIAQHVTIGPDGTIWPGRDWNKPPASASGYNGNTAFGPFMIEMVGDFDAGRDRLEGAQRAATLEVIAAVQARFNLPERSLHFHRSMSQKTCPGSALDYDVLVREVEEARAKLKAAPEAGARGMAPFEARFLEVQQVIDGLGRGEGGVDPAGAELPEKEADAARWVELADDADGGEARGGGAAGKLSAQQLAALAPFVVNLSQGRFSRRGELRTAPDDVDLIFNLHLQEEAEVAKAEKRPLRLVFFAHGGLVSEAGGLAVAHKHLAWWRANGVYPVNFIWETGLVETLRAFLPFGGQRGVPEAEARGISDISDRLIEEAIHVPGEKVWGAMKRAAERAVDPIPVVGGNPVPEDGGGGTYVAQALADFCNRQAGNVRIELHAAGHSAGSIFHSHFLPAALQLGAPAFQSLHFLAPAVTVQGFKARLAGLLGAGIGPLTVYTMKKALELADTCSPAYRKSLLYLIFFALERRRETPLLGLQESLLADADLRRIFGLAGGAAGDGELVLSETVADSGRRASRATTHGGFDDDVATMDSVLRRVLGVGDAAPIRSYREFKPTGARGAAVDPWTAPAEPGPLALLQPLLGGALPLPPQPGAAAAVVPAPAVVAGAVGGRRRALCIGIDAYPTARLGGCVADANLWARTLVQLGFEQPAMLLDEAATRSAILAALERLVGEGRSGDILVFQFAGHGTQVKDPGSDEPDAKDEAFCPIDFASGALLVDDDVAAVFRTIPDGVNVTCFIDCCHSGSITRLAGGGPAGAPADPTTRKRYIVPSAALDAAHLQFRGRLGLSRAPHRVEEEMREVTFSACQPHEVAFEVQGQGEFTRRATAALAAGVQGLTHAAFQQRVESAFGPTPRQHPHLHCAPSAEARQLLQTLAAS